MISYDDIQAVSMAFSHHLTHLSQSVVEGTLTVAAWNELEARHKRIVAGLIASQSEAAKPVKLQGGPSSRDLPFTYHRECWQCSDTFITADQSRGWCVECINEQKGHTNEDI